MNENIPISDELLVKYLLQETTEQEIESVEAWIHASADNEQYFHQLQTIWQESKVLQQAITIHENDSWESLKSKLTTPAPSMHLNRRYFYYAAASVAVILALLFFFKKSDRLPQYIAHHTTPEQVKDTIPSEQTTIPVKKLASMGATRNDTLSDKSVVTLNKHSTLTCPDVFIGNERRVSLEGEAFFKITPDKNKPFFINANNDVEIRVVGTSFNVKSYTDFTEVIVETGIVEVRKFNRVVMLHPREKAKIRKSDSSIVIQKNTDKLYRYYRNKEFECDNLPLWRLVEVLNEAYGDSVVIGRKELRGLTLDTHFDNLPLEHILELISETFDIKVEKQGNKYILK